MGRPVSVFVLSDDLSVRVSNNCCCRDCRRARSARQAIAPTVSMKSRESLLSFLMELGTSGIPHSGGGLLSHLLGTDVILEHWGAPSHVCRAGLFHAVYGTHSFHDSPLSPTDDSRSRIRDVIGPEAEDVVYCYSILDYASIERSLTGVSSRDLASAVVCVQTSARRVLSVPA